ncbi:hypothetical protein [Ulvibacterium sp.]|uniref:hypothetical protein n=1 Tax=Ulvibacterium sp. TaxID=2665914 RepID=UPI003BAAB14B
MKKCTVVLCALFFCLLSSFKPSAACEYAGSNIGFVKSQTEKAIAMENINQARYYAYKALNAIVKSRQQLSECGCKHAVLSIEEGFENLKRATRTTTLSAAKILLNRALEYTKEGLEALLTHETHDSPYPSDVLEMNTKVSKQGKITFKETDLEALKKKIDMSLVDYQRSLDNVINSVDCKEAKAFAKKIHDHCEQQLLRPNLTEGKKYYNLRTKQISAAALKQLGSCENQLLSSR